MPEALSHEAGEELQAILALCERLLKVGDTRLVFTSREALPAPFDAERNHRPLHQLDREDAVKLVERVLNAAGLQSPPPLGLSLPTSCLLSATGERDQEGERICNKIKNLRTP